MAAVTRPVRRTVGGIGSVLEEIGRQLSFYATILYETLSGSAPFEGETSDGDRRSHGPGSAVLLEDTAGKGHRAWVVGDGEVLATVVQLPD